MPSITKTTAILPLLRPWKRILAEFEIALTSSSNGTDNENTSTTRDGDGVATILLHLPDQQQQPRGVVREAMDLLALAVILDGKLLRALARREWICTTEARAVPDTSIRTIRFQVVVHNGLDRVHTVWAALEKILFRHADEQSAPTPPDTATTSTTTRVSRYQAARHSLVQHIRRRGLQARLNEPLRIIGRIHVAHAATPPRHESFKKWMAEATPLQAQTFFKQLATLAFGLRIFQQTLDTRSTSTVQFELGTFEIHLDMPLPTTPLVVQATTELMVHDDTAGRIVFRSVMLDPRMVSCSADDLATWMRLLSQGSPGLSVTTGFESPDAYPNGIDATGQDLSTLIVAMLRAIGGCERLESVDLSPLLALIQHSRNRECFWRALLEELLLHVDSSPIGTLSFGKGVRVDDNDARWMEQLAELATRPRRHVRCLRLHTARPTTPRRGAAAAAAGSHWSSVAGFIGVVAIVRDMAMLDVTLPRQNDEDECAVITKMLPHCFSSLRSLRLHKSTGGVLVALAQSCLDGCVYHLEELELVDVASSTNDRRGWGEFLQRLAQPTTWLAQSLHTMVITTAQGDVLRLLKKEAAAELHEMLQTNRTLRNVHVWLCSDVPLELATALASHSVEQVTWRGPSVDHTATKLAFLSVVGGVSDRGGGAFGVGRLLHQLDVVVINQIFAFAGPTATRVVQAEYYDTREDFSSESHDSDDDDVAWS